ncbi:hypothetical protein ACJX0J_024442 [Zea mays]
MLLQIIILLQNTFFLASRGIDVSEMSLTTQQRLATVEREISVEFFISLGKNSFFFPAAHFKQRKAYPSKGGDGYGLFHNHYSRKKTEENHRDSGENIKKTENIKKKERRRKKNYPQTPVFFV